MNLAFTKMHSLGNDWVIVNALVEPIKLTPENVRLIADRHLGVGCDQILVIEPSLQHCRVNSKCDGDIDFYCRIFNADGTEAGLSGNGLRCLAHFAYASGLTAKRSFVIATCARKTSVVIEEDGQITLNVGIPDFVPESIPFLAKEQALSYNLSTFSGDNVTFGAVSVGNPHVVIRVDDVTLIDVNRIGAEIEKHALFPERVNVNFMQVLNPNNIKLRTYERGTGETLACGSGSCAAVAVGRKWQLLGEDVTVHLRQGNLGVKWQNANSPLFLTGFAEIVFSGLLADEFLQD